MRYVKAFGRFWFDFVIGDDWKIAAGVSVALAALVGLLSTDVLSEGALTVVGALLVMTAFVVSLLVDVRLSKK